MASWSNRDGPQTANKAGSRRQNMYEASLDDASPRSGLHVAIEIDHQDVSSSSESDTDIHPTRSKERPRRPQHLRSLSHPFPSLFTGKKKRQGFLDQASSDSDSDAQTGGNSMAKARSKTTGRSQSGGHGSQGTGHDIVNGNCMTCGSLLRWPGDVSVFRCTICMTINDLVPAAADTEGRRVARHDNDHDNDHGNDHHGSAIGLPVATSPSPRYISLALTRRIIHKCLFTFIEKTLETGDGVSHVGAVPRASLRDGGRGKSGVPLASRASLAGPRRWVSPKASYGASGQYLFDEPPTLRPNPPRGTSSSSRSYSSSYPERPPMESVHKAREQLHDLKVDDPTNGATRIFKSLEDYLISCFSSPSCVDSSFLTGGSRDPARSTSVTQEARLAAQSRRDTATLVPESTQSTLCHVDPKLLLLGDFAENGSWWTGGQTDNRSSRSNTRARNDGASRSSHVNFKSPHVDWNDVLRWYMAVINVAEGWRQVLSEVVTTKSLTAPSQDQLRILESQLLIAQHHTQRVLFKVTEMLLKRPGRPITDPSHVHFLLVAVSNPLLYPWPRLFHGYLQSGPRPDKQKVDASEGTAFPQSGPLSGHHSGIIKRIVGLMANSSQDCRSHVVGWFSKLEPTHFKQVKDLVSGFLSYRLLRAMDSKREAKIDVTAELIPRLEAGGASRATLHSALGPSPQGQSRPKSGLPKKVVQGDDWQIQAASTVLGLLFTANNASAARRDGSGFLSPAGHAWGETGVNMPSHSQILSTSDFYNSLVDEVDLIGDFEAWEARKAKFTFCQYPFLLSISAKIRILEHEARRQMLSKARDAFFDSIMTHKTVNQYLSLDVRRDCLVEDSLKGVSEVVGSGSEDIQKRLRINFAGEEGVDHGGLRKEWFLLLIREVFNADHGMFVYDEDSQYCYFNPHSFETSDQFFLVGVVIGLAIYNSTILDVPLPPFAFRKLLASGSAPSSPLVTRPRHTVTHSLEDLAEFRPALARGLGQLLEFDGDVQETFSLCFVVDTDRFGTVVSVPLCPDGEKKTVTNGNRREYVDLYTRYLLDSSVSRQFEPFKRGFYTVCRGSALSLFSPDEIELLVRGSDEPLDISSLRAVAEYENWGCDDPAETEPVVGWFWETFEKATPSDQRRLLSFITGSDRIPAMGATLLHIKLSCLGPDCARYPIARTCFNVLALWRYRTREKLERVLWRAAYESEGFGLK